MDDLKFAAQTDTGNRREKNEDAFRVNERLRFIAVADGVGGEPAGEIASRLAVEQIEDYVTSHIGEAAPLSTLDDAVTLANDVIYQAGPRRPVTGGYVNNGCRVSLDQRARFCRPRGRQSRLPDNA